MADLPLVLLVQLPIPPPGPEPIEGNVPLAAAYLKLFARRRGLEKSLAIELLPAELANRLGDQALIEAILARRPWMVGFSCYLWNVERSLWIAERLKQRRPELRIVLGGPEITADNAWTLEHPAVDHAVFGEGEQAFADLLMGLNVSPRPLAGEGTKLPNPAVACPHPNPLPKGEGTKLPPIDLDTISSPYVEGILDMAGDGRMSLETARGCRFRCKYCYYPKSHAGLRFLSARQIEANLKYAVEHGAAEVVLLDPTLNQRPDFADFLRLLRRCNFERKLKFSGELRAEEIDADSARLLREANFHEVEVGLQSVEPAAWKRMGRLVDLAAFERGAKALVAEGIRVQADLILGLPGDTVDSVRRGIEFLSRKEVCTTASVFNLSILPGTAFRREARRLRLKHQPWPPYYVVETPTLDLDDLLLLMEEAQEAFGVEFDAMPPPRLDVLDPRGVCRVDLDDETNNEANKNNSRGPTARGKDGGPTARGGIADECRGPLAPGYLGNFDDYPTLAYTLWFRSSDFHRRRRDAVAWVERLLADNPHTTLQVVLEPTGEVERLTVETLEMLLAACYRTTTYLDRYYSMQPGGLMGSKRLVVALSPESAVRAGEAWRRRVAEYATLVE